jgi:hypothetical protein
LSSAWLQAFAMSPAPSGARARAICAALQSTQRGVPHMTGPAPALAAAAPPPISVATDSGAAPFHRTYVSCVHRCLPRGVWSRDFAPSHTQTPPAHLGRCPAGRRARDAPDCAHQALPAPHAHACTNSARCRHTLMPKPFPFTTRGARGSHLAGASPLMCAKHIIRMSESAPNPARVTNTSVVCPRTTTQGFPPPTHTHKVGFSLGPPAGQPRCCCMLRRTLFRRTPDFHGRACAARVGDMGGWVGLHGWVGTGVAQWHGCELVSVRVTEEG